MRNLVADLEREVELNRAYDAACDAHSKEDMDKIHEEAKAFYEELMNEGSTYRHLMRCYANAKRYENELLEIDEPFVDTPVLVEALKKYGVEKFAFTSSWSGALAVALELQKNGCVLLGLGEVNDDKKFGSTEYSKKAAMFFQVSK